MCVAVPARILSISGENALVDLQGNSLTICISLVPQAKIGDYVLIHAGFAIHTIDREEALETLALWEELDKFARGI